MEKRTYRIRSRDVWDKVRTQYLAGVSARTLCETYDISEPALRARATRQGWSRHMHAAPPQTATATALGSTPPPALPFPPPPLFDPGLVVDSGDPAVLGQAAAQASGRAMMAQAWGEARALASLAETYRKMADRDRPAGAARMTVANAPLQLVFDILTNPAEAARRFAMNTSDRSDWDLRERYWEVRERLDRADVEWSHAQLARRVQLDCRIAALEDQLREAGLDPVIEPEEDRRISQGLDLYLGAARGVMSIEEWGETLDEL